MKMLERLLVVLLLVGLWSCNKEYDPTPDYLEAVYPIESGKFRVYHVVDTIFETANSDLLEGQTYYKRELTGDTEEDLLGRTDRELTNGPAKLTKAFGIDGDHDGWDLAEEGPLFFAAGTPAHAVESSPRIGIDYAAPADRAAPWRFTAPGNRYVSRRR